MQQIKSIILGSLANFSLLLLGFVIMKVNKTSVAQSDFAEPLIMLIILIPALPTLYRMFKPFTPYNFTFNLTLFLVLLYLNTALFMRAFVYITSSNGCYNPWF